MHYRVFMAALCVCLGLSGGHSAKALQTAASHQWNGVYVAKIFCNDMFIKYGCDYAKENVTVIIKDNMVSDKGWPPGLIEIDASGKTRFNNFSPGSTSFKIAGDNLSLIFDSGNILYTTIYVRQNELAIPVPVFNRKAP